MRNGAYNIAHRSSGLANGMNEKNDGTGQQDQCLANGDNDVNDINRYTINICTNKGKLLE